MSKRDIRFVSRDMGEYETLLLSIDGTCYDILDFDTESSIDTLSMIVNEGLTVQESYAIAAALEYLSAHYDALGTVPHELDASVPD